MVGYHGNDVLVAILAAVSVYYSRIVVVRHYESNVEELSRWLSCYFPPDVVERLSGN